MKQLLAFLSFLAVSVTFVGPFALLIYAFVCAFNGSLLTALGCGAAGLLLLWLIKPISVITDKDFKIF